MPQTIKQTFGSLWLIQFRESPKKAWLETIGTVVSLVGLFVRTIGNASPVEILGWTGFAIFVIGYTIYDNGLRAWQVERDAREEANERVRKLESRQALLDIVYEQKEPMWSPGLHIVRLGVKNHSSVAQAEHVELRAMEIEGALFEWNVLPTRLVEMHGVTKQVCNINPTDTAYFDLVYWELPDLVLWTEVGGGNGRGIGFAVQQANNYSCLVTVKLSALNASPKTAQFKLTRKPNQPPEIVPQVTH